MFRVCCVVGLFFAFQPMRAEAYALYGHCNGADKVDSLTLSPKCQASTDELPLYISSGQFASVRNVARNATLEWGFFMRPFSVPYINIATSGCRVGTYSGSQSPNLAIVSKNVSQAGQMDPKYGCGAFGLLPATLEKADIRVDGSNPPFVPSCALSLYTQLGTWVHELGHAYGQAHFDDYLATMNTSNVDVSSCKAVSGVKGASQKPSADTMAGFNDRYGLATAYDLGGTMTVQNGPLYGGMQNAGSVRDDRAFPWSLRNIDVDIYLRFTSMNLRSEWPENNAKVTAWWVSVDGSSQLLEGTFYVSKQAFDTRQYRKKLTVTPANFGTDHKYCLELHWDPTSDVTEKDEADNVTDTQICIQLLPF